MPRAGLTRRGAAQSGGIRRNQAPVLMRLREEVVDGKYALVLGFDSTLPFPEWEVRCGSRAPRPCCTGC